MDEKEDNPSSANHFIAGGRENLLEDPDFQKQIVDIKIEIKQKYQEQLAAAGFLRGIIIKMKMRWEINQKIEHLAPTGALYFTKDNNSPPDQKR